MNWKILLALCSFVASTRALTCESCDTFICPEVSCPDSSLVKGVCGCCNVCSKLEGQSCGGIWHHGGKCDPEKKLECYQPKTLPLVQANGIVLHVFLDRQKPGVCRKTIS
ncbi:venom protein 302-like [Styela clava]